MKPMILAASVTLLALGAAAQAQVAPAPAVGVGSVGGNAAVGTTGRLTTPSASGDRARAGRDALNEAPSSTITGTTTGATSLTPPPIAGTPATTGTSVNGDGSTTTPGTPGTAGTPPRH